MYFIFILNGCGYVKLIIHLIQLILKTRRVVSE